MAIITKPESGASIPNSKTTIADSGASIPNSQTTIADSSAAIPNSKTTIADSSASIPNSQTTIAGASASIPNSKTTIADSTPTIPTTKTTITGAAIPRTLTPLVGMNFAANCYSQNGNPVEFSDLFTYSRSSSATFINRRLVNNKYEYFLDTDYVGDVENLLTYSEQLDHADWTKANATISTNSGFDENGDKLADRVYPTTTGTLRGVNQSVTLTTADHNISFKVKAAGFNWVKIFDGAGVNGAWFNISTGVIGTISGSTEAEIEPLGNDWYRCSISDAGAVSGTADLILADSDNTTTATTSGTNGVLVIGCQATLSTKKQPYVKTISTSVTETFNESIRLEYDPLTGDSLGALVERASTNLQIQSESFDNAAWSKTLTTVTANAAKAPDGTFSADKIVPDNAATGYVNDLVNFTSGTVYTASIFVKSVEFSSVLLLAQSSFVDGNQFATFDLINGTVVDSGVDSSSIKYIADGWYRISITVTANATGLSAFQFGRMLSGDGSSGVYMWGAQTEEGIMKSYIPTESSVVTRLGDGLYLNGVIFDSSRDYTVNCKVEIGSLDTTSVRTLYAGAGTSFFQATSSSTVWQLNAGVDGFPSTTIALGSNNLSFVLNGITGSNTNKTDSGVQTVVDEDVGNRGSYNTRLGVGNSSVGTGLLSLDGNIKELSIYDVSMTTQEVSLL